MCVCVCVCVIENEKWYRTLKVGETKITLMHHRHHTKKTHRRQQEQLHHTTMIRTRRTRHRTRLARGAQLQEQRDQALSTASPARWLRGSVEGKLMC